MSLIPFIGIKSQIRVHVHCNLEITASATAEEISVNFVERYSRVEIDALLLEFGFLQNEQRHELAEQLSHGFHTGVASLHVINLVAHRHEHCLYTARARCVVQLGEAVGDVAHADKCQRLLHIVKGFLEAVQSADPAKGEMFIFARRLVAVRCSKYSVASQQPSGNRLIISIGIYDLVLHTRVLAHPVR